MAGNENVKIGALAALSYKLRRMTALMVYHVKFDKYKFTV